LLFSGFRILYFSNTYGLPSKIAQLDGWSPPFISGHANGNFLETNLCSLKSSSLCAFAPSAIKSDYLGSPVLRYSIFYFLYNHPKDAPVKFA
jgi:hypothetical protein